MQRPDLNPSHLVQEALEAWTRSHAAPVFPQERPDDAQDAFALARERLSGQAREEFERGYRAALEAAEVLDLWVIESLAKRHFEVVAWAADFAQTSVEAAIGMTSEEWAPDNKIIGALVKALGNLIGPWGDDAFRPSAPYLRGFVQAMRDLWEESFEGTVSLSGSTSWGQARSRSGGQARSKSGGQARSRSGSRSRDDGSDDVGDPALGHPVDEARTRPVE